jgi:hypothetical protein
MRTIGEIDSKGRIKRVFHRSDVEAWDHPVAHPIKRYLRTVGPCPECKRKDK